MKPSNNKQSVTLKQGVDPRSCKINWSAIENSLLSGANFCAKGVEISQESLPHLEGHLRNWRFGVTFFLPQMAPGYRLLGAFIIMDHGKVCHCMNSDKKPLFVSPSESISRAETGSKPPIGNSFRLGHQKSSAVSSVLPSKAAKECSPTNKKPHFRKLGGGPMTVSFAHKLYGGGYGVHEFFECRGQKEHDSVAGAYLALKAGATLFSTSGRKINFCDLERAISFDSVLEYYSANSAGVPGILELSSD
jgi:hypothetical protein